MIPCARKTHQDKTSTQNWRTRIILLNKLNHCVIEHCPFKLLEIYLSHRLQYIEHHSIKSEYIPTTTGVPQGFILGPIIFVIYLDDISFSSKLFKCIAYADDTTLFANFSNLNKNNKLNKELAEISSCLKVNKLSLNSAKLPFMICRKSQTQIKLPLREYILKVLIILTF